MKKTILIVAIVMVAVMIAMIFVGCSAESYQKQLESKGYDVEIATRDSEEGKYAMDAMVAMLKFAGIDIKGNLEYIVVGKKDDSAVCIVKFEKSSDAKELKNQLKDAENMKVSVTGKIVKITISE